MAWTVKYVENGRLAGRVVLKEEFFVDFHLFLSLEPENEQGNG